MNIALVVYSHYSRDARVRRYAETLSRKNHSVDVICLGENYIPREEKIRLIYYPVNRLRLGKWWYVFEYFCFFIFSFFSLSIRNIQKKYRIIHINNMPDILVFSAIIPKLFGTKIILDMHDPMPELYKSKYDVQDNNFMVKTLKLIERTSMGFADMVITANPVFRNFFISRNSTSLNKISVILNCPDEKMFKYIKMKHRNNAFFHLLYMGTVEKRFGLDIAVDGMAKLFHKYPDITFTIIPKLDNEGEYIERLKEKINNLNLNKSFCFLKPQPLESIDKILKKTDVGIVLAKNGKFTESILPVKLLEFIQMRVPVIATKTRILSQNFDKNMLFFLNKNTPEEFSSAIEHLYANPMLRKNLATNAIKYLVKYNWKIEERKYLSLINTLGK
ncbi:hypothetical protein COV53_02110 [Candidatus Gottesmanbacteria bacterium CG11_big_fil_rev_8_21_14_0_20_37_11]|uniref:Glycosyl transferase family 1 domain-containing protein n=3 Tax=Candidatus Gottesmaniibacteriota TaxID=1752720 RepID=A0A2M7RPN4_9BACT|nr:MAG: hypothetical protein AUJ73_01380 [Candidatus Gottesmanbacteria bacterium CG1_02_37_22]PIR08610.1 MAG: hypothetical protein COV53_02110 [Candidatus Gottesmanbacteria bacterium CG11_big_fil_rev_8_21_14_0_20_37_11]PIZ02287.1 MAG: hypothetical protein COY59_05535 [Candidatus Gottesmanbacteria bacterium CG_4_10_14_0_8_um_filter_37_24]